MIGCVICPVFRPVDKPRLPNWPPCCDSCRTRLRVELAEIPDLYALIPDHLEPETGTGVKVSGTRTPPLPLRLDPLNLLVAGPKRQPVHDAFGDQYGPQPPLVVLDLWVAEWIDTRGQGERQPVPTISTLTGRSVDSTAVTASRTAASAALSRRASSSGSVRPGPGGSTE